MVIRSVPPFFTKSSALPIIVFQSILLKSSFSAIAGNFLVSESTHFFALSIKAGNFSPMESMVLAISGITIVTANAIINIITANAMTMLTGLLSL